MDLSERIFLGNRSNVGDEMTKEHERTPRGICQTFNFVCHINSSKNRASSAVLLSGPVAGTQQHSQVLVGTHGNVTSTSS